MSQLILLTKYPTPWEVKTRLWKEIGMEQSAYVQRRCIEKLLKDHGSSQEYDLHILLRQSDKLDQFCEEFRVDHNRVWVQQGDSLWEIIANAFEVWFDAGHQEVVVIGSDTPLISAPVMCMLFSPLREQGLHCTLWAVEDGWYYGIGANDVAI